MVLYTKVCTHQCRGKIFTKMEIRLTLPKCSQSATWVLYCSLSPGTKSDKTAPVKCLISFSDCMPYTISAISVAGYNSLYLQELIMSRITIHSYTAMFYRNVVGVSFEDA